MVCSFHDCFEFDGLCGVDGLFAFTGVCCSTRVNDLLVPCCLFITEQEDKVTSVEQSWLRCSCVVDVDAITETFEGVTDEAAGILFAKVYLVDV